MPPVLPTKCCGEDGAEQTEDGPEVRNDLQGCSDQRPQCSPRDTDDREAGEPEHADSERVLQLTDGPALERGGGDVKVIGSCHYEPVSLSANSTGN